MVGGRYHGNTRYSVLAGHCLVIEQCESMCCSTVYVIFMRVLYTLLCFDFVQNYGCEVRTALRNKILCVVRKKHYGDDGDDEKCIKPYFWQCSRTVVLNSHILWVRPNTGPYDCTSHHCQFFFVFEFLFIEWRMHKLPLYLENLKVLLSHYDGTFGIFVASI